ncbi:TPA: serine hydroxymethyltransferase [bacterium]|nr:serine hydroxymethyltransferase [bacterium]
MENLKNVDSEVYQAIEKDNQRQNNSINLIASENYTSLAIREACSSMMTNKYAEGYPGRRYYGGCEFVDIVENLAIERAKELFGVEYVNVQPHSGTQANMAVYIAFLKPGDTIMGMDLSCGGHLSHGSKVNFSGEIFNAVTYWVSPKTYELDYDSIRALAKRYEPRMIICGASAYPRIIDFNIFKKIADEVDAILVADIAHIAGLIASDVHPSPVGTCDLITSTTHKTLRGPRGGMIMGKEEYGRLIDKTVFPGIQGGPLMHIIAGKAVCFKEALSNEFREYAKQIVKNAKALADCLLSFGFKLITGGTDNHLLLIDLRDEGLVGRDAEKLLEQQGIIVNKNAVPYDSQPPTITSGIRIGTPAVTTRGMKEDEMKEIARMINTVLRDKKDVKKDVLSLCQNFPVI